MKRFKYSLSVIVATTFFSLCNFAAASTVFFDDFEYAVDRNTSGAVQTFQSQGGWNYAKTYQDGESGARGHLYTTTSIPGYSGSFPGTNSNRVLVMEGLPITYGGQTDYYLQIGDGEDSAYDNFIPGDVWFQFWLYSNYYGNQMSQYGGGKFLYVCNTNYPCHSHKWMMIFHPKSWNPNMALNPLGVPSNGEYYLTTRGSDGVGEIVYSPASTYDQDKLGQTELSEWIKPNAWTLVKIHFDTTSTSGNSWEMWMRPFGGSWTKTAEWIGGVTPNFTWNLNVGDVGGHRVLRMPTTSGDHDYWIYMDDFTIATSETDLPIYNDAGGPSSLEAPSNLRIAE